MPYPTTPTEAPDTVTDLTPNDIVATPEGDNEFAPDQPLTPSTIVTPERPRGNEPHTEQPIRPAQP